MKMMPLLNKIGFLGSIVGLIFIAGCASQDEMFTLDDRLSTLEQQQEANVREQRQLASRLDGYSKSRLSDDQSLRGQAATLRVDIDTLREELNRLKGRLEETLYAINQKTAPLEDVVRQQQNKTDQAHTLSSENLTRINHIENYLNFERAQGSTTTAAVPTTGGSPTKKEKPLPEDERYSSAKQLFDKGDFDAARKGFASLIQRFPRSGHADNAQFWIGESYYKEKWYEKAILEYQKVIEKYPKGNKVKSSLLKQGFAFLNLGDAANARLILKELIRKYSKSNEAAIARTKLKSIK